MYNSKNIDADSSVYVAQSQAEEEAADKAIADEYFLGKYCRHIPRILRRQLISKLVNQYVLPDGASRSADSTPKSIANRVAAFDPRIIFESSTSICRFHGTLLFVDISGFTVLSQKMKVDDLKNQINAYFQKIVNIIDKYDGEIIKFAGDALFIIWQTKVNSTEDPSFHQAAKEATQSAVKCGIEINVECGNYAINLSKGTTRRASKFNSKFNPENQRLYSETGNAELAQGILDLAARSDEHTSEGAAPSSNGLRVTIDGPLSPTQTTFSRKVKAKPKKAKALVTYLNIHAGVSVGVMAGMDVGAQDRFEFMLLGQPMNDVAIAEGDAGKGEIVVSPAVHSLIHDASSLKSPKSPNGHQNGSISGSPRPALPCGCVLTPSGFYCIPSESEEAICEINFGAGVPAIPANAPTTKQAEQVQDENREAQYDFELYSQVVEELLTAYKSIAPFVQEQFASVLSCDGQIPITTDPGITHNSTLEGSDTLDADTQQQLRTAIISVAGNTHAVVVEHTQKEVLTEHFFAWAQHCLLDDIAKHVHEVVRKGFSFYQESRASPFEHFLRSPAAVEAYQRELERVTGAKPTGAGHSFAASPPTSTVRSPRSSVVMSGSTETSRRNSRTGKDKRDSFVNKIRHLNNLSSVRERKQNKHQKVLSKDGALVSELRNVIVLFISVKMDQASLYQDPVDANKDAEKTIKTCKVDSFHFLNRTVEEIEADKKLVNQFQSCMEVLTEVFHAKGGQLRQFIVDDKGTVCIGTFGLRGSVNYDNAASAIDAADTIVARLQALGFNASVGVTSGAAYCGLVGSNTRHEYAVMGPSTNLSARLMGRAAEGEIICDSTIRQRDRMHTYASLGAVKAKGYTNPVPIFKPQFGAEVKPRTTVKLFRSQSTIARAGSSRVTNTLLNKLGVTDTVDVSTEVFGRKSDTLSVFEFFFASATKGDVENLTLSFWRPDTNEDPTKLDDLSHVLAPFPFAVHRLESTKRSTHLRQEEQRCRFDISLPTKLAMIVAPNGMGKSLVLDLFHSKISLFVQKDKRFYNIAVFRHQAGYINSATLFSAWYSQVKQTLFSIAESLAESDETHSTRYLHALNLDDCDPIIDFLREYLPVDLRPYTALLAMVGVNLTDNRRNATASPIAESAEEETSPDETTQIQNVSFDNGVSEGGALYGAEIQDVSDKTDPVDALDPVEKLQRCAELIVAIAQLHVKITRKITLYIMDDLQYYDPLSQDLQRLMCKDTTGITLLCTYRASTLESAPPVRSQTLTPELVNAAAVVADASSEAVVNPRPAIVRRDTHSVSPENAALFNSPNSDTFLRVCLAPLTPEACQQLFTKVFGTYGITVVEDSVFTKLQALSGGSPLYAVELAKSICERYIHRECDSTEPQSTSLCNQSLVAIIDDLRTDRIEEMVHFRFDKLTEQCQLVLKMAAVASVNGSHFTFALLRWVLDSTEASESGKFDSRVFHTADNAGEILGNGPDASDEEGSANGNLAGFAEGSRSMESSKGGWDRFTMNLSQALNDLLEAGEFIEFRERGASGRDTEAAATMISSWLSASNSSSKSLKKSPKHMRGIVEGNEEDGEGKGDEGEMESWGFDRGTLDDLRFFWKVDMELRAIYDLMLDEQKESLHDRVASFLEQEYSDGRVISSSEWFQLASHWERATSFSSAMTCYFNAGMLLKEQGDSLGCKEHFTAAFRMLDRMRNEVGQKTNTVHVGRTPTLAEIQPVPVEETQQNNPNRELLGLLHALGGQRSGLTVQDLYKLYEGDAHLLHVGFSLIIRVAQGLIGFENSALSIKLFEEAMEMMQVLMSNTRPMRAVDGLPFVLRNTEICFAVLSGMFLLLLTGQAQDDALHSRVQATVAVSIMLARSDPAFTAHLIMALASKLKMLDLFQAANPAVTPGIIATATELMGLYDPALHSPDLVYFYEADRAGNAFCVVLKTMCMKGQFRDNVKFLDHAKQIVTKTKHFYSLSLGILVLFPILLMYHSDAQAQVLYQRYRKTEAKQQKNDFRDGVAIWMEWCSQAHWFEQMKQRFDETIYADESIMVDRIIQARLFAQDQQSHFYLNLVRLHCIGVEYAVANICYLKALKFELYAMHYKTPQAYRAIIKNYLQLGLIHLTFTPSQAAMNQMFLFSNLHEKLLRAQLLMKSVTYSDNLSEARASWAAALENLLYCAAVGQRNGFQAVLLQTGVLLQALAGLSFPEFAPDPVPVVAATKLSVEAEEVLGAGDITGATVSMSASEPALEAACHRNVSEENGAASVPSGTSLCEAELMQRAGLKAQGAAIQAQALQYLKEMNGEEVVEELLRRKFNVQMPNTVDVELL